MEDKNCLNRIRVLRAFDPGELSIFTFDKYLDVCVRRLVVKFTDYDGSDPTAKKDAGSNPVNEITALYQVYGYSLIGALVNNLHLLYDASLIPAKLGLLFQNIEEDCQANKADRKIILNYLDKFSESSIESMQQAIQQLLCMLYNKPADIAAMFNAEEICWDTKYLFYKGQVQNDLLFSELLQFIKISVADYSVPEYQLSLLIKEFINYKGEQAYGEAEAGIKLQRGRHMVRAYLDSKAALRSVYHKNLHVLGKDLFVIFRESYPKQNFLQDFIDPLLASFGLDDGYEPLAKIFRRKSDDFQWLRDFCGKNRSERLLKDTIRKNYFFGSKYSVTDDEAFRKFWLPAYAGITDDDMGFKKVCYEAIEICRSKSVKKDAEILKKLTLNSIVILFLLTDDDTLKWHLAKIINSLTVNNERAYSEVRRELANHRYEVTLLPRIVYQNISRKFELNNR